MAAMKNSLFSIQTMRGKAHTKCVAWMCVAWMCRAGGSSFSKGQDSKAKTKKKLGKATKP
jgi:hypothetical protein